MTAANSNTTSVLPDQRMPIIDRYRRWSPTWWRFLKPLLESVNQNSETLAAVSEDLTTAQASITTEQTVRANADGALASQITTLSVAYQLADAGVSASLNASITNEATARADADGVLSSQISTVAADFAAADTALSALVTNEATARINGDGVLASQISAVSASYVAADSVLSASVTSEASARINKDGALAQDITSLTTTVNGNTISINQVSSTVNGQSGRWSVSLNANDRVVGMIRLDGTATQSEVAILADKFLVVHPTANATTIQAFIVGLVGGVSTVGVNGNLIVDDTILARHIVAGSITASKIAVGELSSLTADVGEVTAGLLRSSDNKFRIDLDNKTLTIET